VPQELDGRLPKDAFLLVNYEAVLLQQGKDLKQMAAV
jgi:hypothetical protein